MQLRGKVPYGIWLNATIQAIFTGLYVFLVYSIYTESYSLRGDSVAEWLACWTQAQKGPGSNRSRDAVG